MEKFLITNKTVGLLKQNNKTIIYNVDNYEVFHKNINKILEYNCNYFGSSLNGRKKSAQSILNIKYKVPIVIDIDNNMILIRLNSERCEDCLYLMFNKIIDYVEIDGKLEILCMNNHKFKCNISKNSLEKLIVNAIKLNNILNWRKNANLL